MQLSNVALLIRARREHEDLGYVTVETRADLSMVGIYGADLEAFIQLNIETGV